MSIALLVLLLGFDASGPLRMTWALRFDGKSHLAAPAPPLNDADAFTLEAWVKDWKGAILCLGKAGDPENSLWISTGNRANSGVPHESCGFESGSGANYEIAAGIAPDGKWMHVALVYGRGELKVFVDGKPKGTVAAPKPGPFDASRELILGAHQYEAFTHGTGLLGPVRISNVARYAAEFTPSPRWGHDDRTLFLLRLREGRGTVARDASGRDRHATIRGAEWVEAKTP